ncbi:MAG TPA: HAD family phosphatase [Bryocella sp.]|nr:HAD family phosphatase [Bryocella sp.]
MPLIRAVLFDFGLVLSGPPDPVAHRRLETILHTTHAELEVPYWRHRHDYDLGVLSGVEFWRTVGNELRHPPGDDELAQLLEADVDLWTQPNQPMIDWAITLQDAGTSTGILSNIGDAMETGIIQRFSWLAGFRHHTFSHRLRIAKPDQRIYDHAINGIGHPAEATLFIDDRIENVEAARAAGLHAIQYSSHENFLRQLQEANVIGLPMPISLIAK